MSLETCDMWGAPAESRRAGNAALDGQLERVGKGGATPLWIWPVLCAFAPLRLGVKHDLTQRRRYGKDLRASSKRCKPALAITLQRSIAIISIYTAALFLSNSPAIASDSLPQSDEGIRVELPENGNLRIENPRGNVNLEVWKENYVTVSAVSEGGEQGRSPAIIQRAERLLSVRVALGSSRARAPVSLVLRIPERAHAAIITTDGVVEVRGLPAALLVQTSSGEIRAYFPAGADADIVAQTIKGGVTLPQWTAAAASNNPGSPIQTRLGAGGRTVRLHSETGNINLALEGSGNPQTAATQSPEPVATPRTGTETQDQTQATLTPRSRRPKLIGAKADDGGIGRVGTPNEGPEEVSEGDVIRVNTELVSVNVSVIDRGTNRGLTGLGKDDFRLWEDNVEQQIKQFDSASAPFNLVLLVDLSGSTTQKTELIKSAAIHFVEAARPFDRISVITFAGEQVVVSPLTTDHEALRQRINALRKPDGSTRLYDSVAFATEEVLKDARSHRNAIVLMSDGLDSVLPNVTGEGSKLPYASLVTRIKEFDGVLYTIWVDTQSYEPMSPLDIQQETFDFGHDSMQELADVGGGTFYEVEELKDLAGAYERIVADLGTVYTLSYRPTNKLRDGTWRAIRVKVEKPDAVARGKRGYYAR
jgi:VWFA-related protein